MKNIVLTGFIGTGKSEVSKELSRVLGWKAIDIDAEIEKSQRMKITGIFKQFGEQGFRDIETEMIKNLSKTKNVIISTGGGAVLRQENMDALRENGVIICLTAAPETILKRTSNNNDRPLLHVESTLKKIRDLLAFGMTYYAKADIIIDTENKTPQLKEEIAKALNLQQKQLDDILKLMAKQGSLVRVNETMYITKAVYEKIINVLKDFFSKKKEMTVAEFRDILNTSRKYALPILEYLDTQRITMRVGDVRKFLGKG
ncbi:SelB domain-containing protein [Candidatus Hakubella thermalkaliphila]|nr:SelB C-terminal domain-containing protein [Candidatus Hakubella thermalkaliphila]